MRLLFDPNIPLFDEWPDNQYSNELKEISTILDDLPEVLNWVEGDICNELSYNSKGSVGLTIEQIF